jgi:hypothetical protein
MQYRESGRMLALGSKGDELPSWLVKTSIRAIQTPFWHPGTHSSASNDDMLPPIKSSLEMWKKEGG